MSDALDFFEKLSELIECPICMQTYELEGSLIPKLLDCGHDMYRFLLQSASH